MTDFALTGCAGKMGGVITALVAERDDCRIVAGIDRFTAAQRSYPIVAEPSLLAHKPDVIIDFSHPSALDPLLDYCLTNGVALVVATTGFTDAEVEKIKKAAQQIPIFFTYNLSLGINLLAGLARRAAAVLGNQFDIEIVEKHHNRKVDAPSGTALFLAKEINDEAGGCYTNAYDRHSVRQKRAHNEIGIHAVRGGTIVGDHEIIFAGHDEVITLSHSAQSKEVFAVGAINAAIFLARQPAGLYDMKNII
ncbi:MAG: 4-hydroxy-tetrahydrodipicolinate reductase [Oscillospiraceae bacterium]